MAQVTATAATVVDTVPVPVLIVRVTATAALPKGAAILGLTAAIIIAPTGVASRVEIASETFPSQGMGFFLNSLSAARDLGKTCS
jgi:hypothetical protein